MPKYIVKNMLAPPTEQIPNPITINLTKETAKIRIETLPNKTSLIIKTIELPTQHTTKIQ